MRRRRLQILVALVVLALCRIVRDSQPAPAPASEAASALGEAYTPAQAEEISLLEPIDHQDDLDWFSPSPVASDSSPSTQPSGGGDVSAQPSDTPVVWVAMRLVLPVTLPDDVSPAQTYVASTASFSPIVNDPPERELLHQMDLVSLGGTGGSTGGGGSHDVSVPTQPTDVSSRIPVAAAPALIVDSPEQNVGGGALPPVVAPSPAPEPPVFGWLLILLLPRASKRRCRVLS